MHRTTIRVRYGETDQMGVAHHSAYAGWLESGRVALCRDAGIPYREIEAAGYNMAVAELTIRYLKPALFDQVLTIETRLARLTPRLIVFDYRITNPDGEPVATAETRHLVVNRNLTRASLPAGIMEKLKQAETAHA